jgi:regulator of protease activity HflC (stomatin/prohibitin superfamily)
MQTVTEKPARKISGYVGVVVFVLLAAVDIYLVKETVQQQDPTNLVFVIPLMLVTFLCVGGFFVVQPNQARVLVLFGKYIGTVHESGFFWANPFAQKKHLSLRIRNFNSEKIKVNDLHGNPIEIAAVVVWRVVDSARALFDVQSFEDFVAIQSETAIRALASEYPYDAADEDRSSLRGNPQEIAESLKKQVQSRLDVAGVEVLESRISHLAYAQEIAQAMLRRQQAQAIIAARQKIVDGAVGMVESALRMLSEHKIIELDEEKKAT